MSAISICSIISVVVILERIFYYRKISKNDEKIIGRILSSINNSHYEEALAICETVPTPVTNLLKVGIKYRDYNENQIQEAIKDAANLEIPKLERFLTSLGTIASIAPLLGLLGTVIGNMEAFGVIGTQGGIGNMEQLAQGISKALITTAYGLIVAIPSTIFYNHLSNKVNNMILNLEIKANELVLLLIKKKGGINHGNKIQ